MQISQDVLCMHSLSIYAYRIVDYRRFLLGRYETFAIHILVSCMDK